MNNLDFNRIPKHIAIIMDGNGRWALEQGKPRSFGHQAGVDAVSNVAGSNLGNWSTRLVTRYVTMPIEFEYRDKGVLRNFRISLGVIPGLSFSSKNTGLKHELEQRGRNYQDSQSGVSRFINPYKLDVRLTFKRKGLGMFLQVPTLPVFIDTATKVYPIKIGFML